MILAGREIEERAVQHFAETEDAVLAIELIRARARDEVGGLGRRGRIRRIEVERFPQAHAAADPSRRARSDSPTDRGCRHR